MHNDKICLIIFWYSPTYFGRFCHHHQGGAAILQVLNKNHHIGILGIKLIKPLLTKNFFYRNAHKKY